LGEKNPNWKKRNAEKRLFLHSELDVGVCGDVGGCQEGGGWGGGGGGGGGIKVIALLLSLASKDSQRDFSKP